MGASQSMMSTVCSHIVSVVVTGKFKDSACDHFFQDFWRSPAPAGQQTSAYCSTMECPGGGADAIY